jgi:hypothetical protein
MSQPNELARRLRCGSPTNWSPRTAALGKAFLAAVAAATAD